MKLRNLKVQVIEALDWATLELNVQAFLDAGGEKELVQLTVSTSDEARVTIFYTE